MFRRELDTAAFNFAVSVFIEDHVVIFTISGLVDSYAHAKLERVVAYLLQIVVQVILGLIVRCFLDVRFQFARVAQLFDPTLSPDSGSAALSPSIGMIPDPAGLNGGQTGIGHGET